MGLNDGPGDTPTCQFLPATFHLVEYCSQLLRCAYLLNITMQTQGEPVKIGLSLLTMGLLLPHTLQRHLKIQYSVQFKGWWDPLDQNLILYFVDVRVGREDRHHRAKSVS